MPLWIGTIRRGVTIGPIRRGVKALWICIMLFGGGVRPTQGAFYFFRGGGGWGGWCAFNILYKNRSLPRVGMYYLIWGGCRFLTNFWILTFCKAMETYSDLGNWQVSFSPWSKHKLSEQCLLPTPTFKKHLQIVSNDGIFVKSYPFFTQKNHKYMCRTFQELSIGIEVAHP